MKSLRHFSFYALVASVSIIVLAATLRPGGDYYYTPAFAFSVLVALFGLSIWSLFYLEDEPLLTRIALILIIALLTVLFLWIGGSATN